ncbi:MAG TPA: hypothetical protein VGJ95_05450 [Pseudonocardiaceae bacterium]
MTSKDEHETVVTEDGVVVPLSELRNLVPGQRVRVSVVSEKKGRRNGYGALAGKVRDVSFEDFEESSPEVWKDWVE